MEAVFPLVQKYGGFVVALTLDEGGIPKSAEGRLAVAKKIIAKAAEYGIGKKDLIFDPLAMTISADTTAAKVTMQSVAAIKNELGVNTSLGVSNVSFGLPERNIVTATFFALCLEEGLSAAIMNPYSAEMMDVYYAFKALHNMDENCMDYIGYASKKPKMQAVSVAGGTGASANESAGSGQDKAGGLKGANLTPLQNAIVRGLKEKSATLTKEQLKDTEPLKLIQEDVIPALNIVGEDFEAKRAFLPQLLMAAEAAKAAFEEVKKKMAEEDTKTHPEGMPFIIATVHGDIHDIGKNIVKLIMENYGFAVTDLGKDVPAEEIVEATIREHAPLVGLSALMTTTVPAMEETIKLMREKAPWAKVCVGGAVLTKEYADLIGADMYCKDAMETVRYAKELEASFNIE